MQNLKFGCFCDDFTGAGDAAAYIQKAGLHTVLVTGVPAEDFILPEGVEAVVVALKIRTVPAADAVCAAQAACGWLTRQGALHLYYKYCSTFDSTDEGNIGPIIDALLESYTQQTVVLCPALPVNGRTVRNGHLYVNGVPLDETHMRHHPLTPMRSSYIPMLMGKQGQYECILLAGEEIAGDTTALRAVVAARTAGHRHAYLVPDCVTESDAAHIARQFHGDRLLTGGSGVLTALCRYYGGTSGVPRTVHCPLTQPPKGRTLILAGSCSAATLAQIAQFRRDGGAALQVRPDRLFADGADTARAYGQIWAEVRDCTEDAVLVYTSDAPAAVRRMQETYGRGEVSARLEGLMADLAVRAAAEGWRKIVVAGGETSGAVAEALHAKAYRVGAEIAPGVPVLAPLDREDMRLVLKSGNFGAADFFARAAAYMTGEETVRHD